MDIEGSRVNENFKESLTDRFQNWFEIVPSFTEKEPLKYKSAYEGMLPEKTTIDPVKEQPWYKQAPRTELDRNRESEKLRSWVIQHSEDPEEELAKLRASRYLAAKAEVDPTYVYNNFEAITKDYYGEPMKGISAWKAMGNAAKTGQIQSELADLYWLKLSGDESEETQERIENLKNRMPSLDEQKRSIPVQAMKSFFEMTPMMVDSMAAGTRKGLAYGAAGAGVAAIAGQAGPQIATPEELITIPAAFTSMYFVGQAAGSSEAMMKKEAGLAYMDMLDYVDPEGNKINPDIARNIALGIGAINGVIEASQVANIPGVDTLIKKATRKSIKKLISNGTFRNLAWQISKKYAGSITSETAQEVLQETVSIVGEEIARQKSGVRGQDFDESIVRLQDTAVQSALAFSVMGLPGSVVNSDVSAAVREMRGPKGIIKVDENTVIPGPDSKMFRNTGTSMAAPVTQVEPSASVNTNSDSYKLARQQYEQAKEGNGTIAPLKVTQGEDGSYQAVDNDMLQVLLEEGERAVEIELVEGPQVAPEVTAQVKPDWMKSSTEYDESKSRFIEKEINFKSVQSRGDMEYNLSQAMPDMDREDVGTLTEMFEVIAESNGMEMPEYIRKYYAEGMFTTEKVNTDKVYAAAAAMVKDGKKILHITKETDFTSIVHEASHIIRGHLPEADLSILSDHYKGIDREQYEATGKWTTPMEEKFTADFMLYLEKGEAPTEQHRQIFQRIAKGIRKVYDVISRREKGGEEVPEHIKAVFDRIFTPEGEVKADVSQETGQQFVAQPSNQWFEKNEKSQIIPMSQIDKRESIKDQAKLERGKEKLRSAEVGTGPKRAPVKVHKITDGKYRIVKGNTTWHILNEKGASAVEAEIVPIQQPTQNLDELYNLMPEAQIELDAFTREIAEKYGAKIIRRNKGDSNKSLFKAKDRAVIKLDPEFGAERIYDIAGSTVVFEDLETLKKAVNDILPDSRIVRLKDRYAKPTDDGYMDILINLQTSSGVIVEAQFNTVQMLEAKSSYGHKLYEIKDQIKKAVENGTVEEVLGKNVVRAVSGLSQRVYKEASLALRDNTSFSASSFEAREELEDIWAYVVAMGDKVLSDKTQKGLKSLVATMVPSQSQNSSPSLSIVNTSDIDNTSTKSISHGKNESNTTELKDMLFQDIPALFEDSDGVFYNKHEEGVDYESREIKEQYRSISEELEYIEEGALLSERGRTEVNGASLSGRPAGSSVLRQWKRQKRVDFSDHYYEGVQSLAEMFSVFRNPLNEYFHIIYVDDNNNILAHNAMTSGIPGRTIAVDSDSLVKSLYRMDRRLERLEASGYFLLHNHPSGNVTQSIEDVNISRLYKENIPGFKGHIILNHTQFAYIGEMLGTTQHDYNPSLKYDPLTVGESFTSPEAIANYSKDLMPDNGRDLLIYMDQKHRVIFSEPVKNLSHVSAYQKMREQGAAKLAYAAGTRESYNRITGDDLDIQDSQDSNIQRLDVFLDILLVEENESGVIKYESAMESLNKTPGDWQASKAFDQKKGYVWENEPLYQDSEHEEIIRQAVEDFKPVPIDVLVEYQDRDWAQKELKRRETMEEYGWLLDMAVGMESPEELKDFILNMGGPEETAALKNLGEEGENRFYHEIWSRANLLTKDKANTAAIEEYGNKEAVVALASEIASDMGMWKNKGVPGAIWTLANNFRWGTATTERQYQNAINSVRNDPVALRSALVAVYKDEDEIRQLSYEQEIELATTEEVQIGRMTEEDRMKEAMKTDDLEIRKMLLTGIGTDSETIMKIDREMHQRIGTLRAQQTKEIEKLQKKLGMTNTQINDLINSRERLEKKAKEEKAEAVAAAIQETKDKIRESIKRRNELKKIKERMRILSKSITRKPAENCHWSFKEEIRNLQDDVDPRFRRKKTAEAIKKRREFYEQNPEIARVINPEILAAINKKPLNDWTLLELESLNNKISKMREAGALKQKEIEDTRRQEVLQLAARMAFEIGNGQIITIPDFITSGDDYKDWKKTSATDKGKFSTWRPSRILKMMGGEDSTLVKVFWREMNKHQDESLRNAAKRKEYGIKKMKELGITWKHLNQKMSVPGTDLESMTINEVIQMYIAQKNEKNMRAFVYGNKIKNPLRYIQQLSDKERALGDFIAADFESHHERYGAAYAEDKNDVLGKVPGYFPMKRQSMLNEVRNDEVMRDMGTSAGVMDGYASRNSTKKRIDIGDEHQAPIRMGAMELWMEEVEKQEHYIESARYIKKLHSILKNQTFQAAMVEKYGQRSITWMEKFINEFANPNLYKFYDATSQLSRTLRNDMAIAYLAGNTITMLKQAPSLALFMGRVGPHRLVAAAGKFMTHPIRALEFVNQRDPQMKERSLSRFTEELKLQQKHRALRLVQKVGKIGMTPIMWIDKMATTIGWQAVYDANILKGEEEAIRLAQEAVLETQPAARAKDLAEIYRSNEGLNWFLMFTNQINQTWNIMTADIPAAVRHGQYVNAMGMVTGMMVSFAGIAVISGWRPWENDDPEEFVIDAATQLGKSIANTIPIVGKSVSSGMDGWWGTGVDPVPAASEIGKMLKVLTELDTENIPKQAGRVAEGIAVLSGIPMMPVKRSVKAWEKLSDEEYEKVVLEFLGYGTED